MLSDRKIKIILVILAVLLGFLHYSIKKNPLKDIENTKEDRAEKKKFWEGIYPPDFELKNLNRENFKLSDAIGKKIIVLNFFTTWCSPCKMEIPELNRFYKQYKDEDFLLAGICVEDRKDKVEKFVKENQILYPVLLDENREIARLYEIEAYPTTIFIGINGKVAFYEIGAISNADVAFLSLFKFNKSMLEKGEGIKKEVYFKRQEITLMKFEWRNKEKGEVILSGRAKKIAEKIKCPSCGRSILKCNGTFSKKIRAKLSRMDLKNKTDEEILKELFLND